MKEKSAVATPVSILTLPQQRTSDCDRNNLLNFECVRVYLNVSRSTLLRYISDRKIEAIKMDGIWRFRWEEVERFVQRRTQKAA
jgi:excisionase family DNA binding protein